MVAGTAGAPDRFPRLIAVSSAVGSGRGRRRRHRRADGGVPARRPTTTSLLLEGSPELGGKLRGAEVAGVRVDVGAEAMLNRRPEGVDLARELGLDVVHPATSTSGLWSRGALRPLPRSLMGVPLDLDDLRRAPAC